MKTKINCLNLLVVFSMVLAVLGLPANVQAAVPIDTNVPSEPHFQVTPNGFVVSSPTLPADTSGLPPAPVVETSQSVSVERPNHILPKAERASDAPHGADPVVQSQPGPGNMPSPLTSWDGIGNTGVQPPDTDGQVGPNHYIQIVNTSGQGSQIRIWDKAGTQLYDFGMNSMWPSSDRCNTYGYGDPVVLYDQLADRWILTQFINPPSAPFSECFAVSKTGTPTNNPSDWWLYNFAVQNTSFPDYPKIGVWPDGYYMMAHQFTGNNWAGTGVWVFERDKMLNGQAATFQYKDLYSVNPNYGGMLPSNLSGNTLPPAGSPNYFAEVDQDWSGTDDVMTLFAFHTDWATPANTTFNVVGSYTVAPFDADLCPAAREQCIDQPGRPLSLEAITDRMMMHLWYRNMGDHEALVTNHTVDGDGNGHAGIRWYELRKTTPSPTAWSIYQQGTYFPNSDHHWMGSIAMDHVGNIALGYSASSSTTYPSIRYTGRLASDPLGTLPQGEGSIVEGGGSFSGYRWGDYSAMSVDPVDDCTFWYTQEYVKSGQTSWSTRVGSFKFPNCSLGPQGVLAGTVTNSANSAPIAGAAIQATASVTQTGGTQSNPDGSYVVNLLTGVYTVTASAYGFLPKTNTGVTISQNATTTLNIALDPAPSYVVSGTVRDALAGWPLYAKVTIGGYPGAPVWTDPATGFYSVTLVAGATYAFEATAFSAGYQPASQSVGPLMGNATVNLNMRVDAATCNAPGYASSIAGLYESFDTATPPALPTGWATVVVTSTSTAASWATSAGTVHPSGQTAHSAPNLAYFNSYSAGAGGAARLYRTTDLDLGDVPTTTLSFWMYHETGYTSDADRVQVQVSLDSGATWQNVGAPIARYDGTTGWKQHTIDLAAYEKEVIRLGFLGISQYGNDVHIDDVLIGERPCLPKSGGLVVGNVTDVNTSVGLDGTAIKNQGGYSTVTGPTPADPKVGDGFYLLFSPAGTQIFTATKTSYKTETAYVSVPLSGTTRQDFALGAGRLTYTPGAMNVTLLAGDVTTLPLTLNNTGNLTATFEIQEGDLGGVPFRPSAVRPPYKPRVSVYWDKSETMVPPTVKPVSTPPLPTTWGTGLAIPTGSRYRSAGASCDGKTYYVFGGQSGSGTVLSEAWMYDPATNTWTQKANMPTALMSMEAVCLDGLIYLVGGYTGSAHSNRFQIYDTAANTWVNSTWPATRTPMTAVANGKLYAFGGNPGPSSEVRMYDPSTGTWSDALAAMPTAVTYGAATTKDDYIYVVGGADSVGASSVVQRYNPAANTWSTGPALPNGRMNAIVVWYGDRLYTSSGGGSGGDIWTAYNDTYWLNTSSWPSGSWTLQGETVLQPVVGAAYDCVNNRIYGAGGTTGGSYFATNQYLDDGQTCHIGGGAGADVPWLSEVPVSGTLASLASQTISVTFNGAVVDPGIYKAGLKFKNDTPYPVVDLPVTLTVNVPATWGKLVGTVSTLGYCDAEPAALSNVTVTVQSASGSWNLVTDKNGYYSRWIESSAGPFTVTVNSPDYQLGQVTGVVLSPQGTTTQDFSLRLLKPCLSASPTSLSVNLSLGQSTTRPFKLTNSGAAAAVYSMTEQNVSAPAAMAAIPAGNVNRLGGYHASGAPRPYALTADLIQDGSFEATDPSSYQNPYWTQGSTAYGTVLCDTAGCGTGAGTAGPRTGSFWVWFGGSSTGDTGHIEQTVQLGGPSTLSFYLWIGASSGGASDYVKLSLDGTEVWRATGAQIGSYGTYTKVSVPLAAGSGSHVVRFDSVTVGSGNFNIDDVSMEGGAGAGSDVPWLTETPVSGTVAADTFLNTTIGFDANAVAIPGTYKANVVVNSNDPKNPARSANMTMVVSAPASWGVLTGKVTSLGRCDATPKGLAGATVVLQGSSGPTRTVTTDGSGNYTVWLSALAGPYTLTASAAKHQSGTASGIVINNLGAVTTQNISLRSVEPCLSYAPPSIAVTVPWQGSITQTLTLSNTGLAGSAFTITEQTGGFIPMSPEAQTYLIVGSADSNVAAFQAALTAAGASSTLVSTTAFNGLSLSQLQSYTGVIWTTSLGPTSSSLPYMQAYLNAGGKLLVAYHDFGYSWRSTASPNFLTTYLQGQYYADSGSLGALTGVDIMAGINPNVSTDPYPDSFTLVGPDAVGVFIAPDTNWAGWRIARNGYKAVILGFNLNYATPTSTQASLVQNAVSWLAAADVTWLSENPTMGSVAANGGVQNVSVAFNANVPDIKQPGTYYAKLNIGTEDLSLSSFLVPVTMTVMPSTSLGKLNGTVTSLGYCDVNPAPLSNATVVLQDNGGYSLTLTTDAAGYFQQWVDAANNPYTLTVSAVNHLPASASISVTGGATTTQNINLRWDRPCVNTAPTSLSLALTMGASATLPLTVSNTGAAPTTFKLGEGAGGFIPLRGEAVSKPILIVNDGSSATMQAYTSSLTSLVYNYAITTTSAYASLSAAALLNSYQAVFYAGYPSVNSAQMTRTMEYLDAGGRFFISDNDFGYGYRNYTTTVNLYRDYFQATYDADSGSSGVITGTDIMSGVITSISTDPYPDSFTITGTEPLGLFYNQKAGTWAGERIARNAYKAVYLAWDYEYAGGSTVGDPVETEIMQRVVTWLGLTPTDYVPWLSENPLNGALNADTGAQLINVTFDAGVAEVNQPGTYYARLAFNTSDPVKPTVNVPVTMTVAPPASWGELTGVVSGLAPCDVNPTLLANADVLVQSATMSWTLKTNASGVYQVWADAAQAPVMVTASQAGFVSQSVAGVSLTAGVSTTQNFALRPLAPCASSAPSSLSTALMPGQQQTQTLMISNTGAAALDWSILELPARPAIVVDTLPSEWSRPTAGQFSFNPHLTTEYMGTTPLVPTDNVSITQSSSQLVQSGNSVACGVSSAGYTAENSYYRVFDLPTFGITGNFNIAGVEFGVEDAVAGGTSQPLAVKLYTLNGPFVLANLTLIGSVNYNVTDQSLSHLYIPITATAPAGSKLVVEIFTPDGSTAVNAFYIGSNNLTETGPSYLRAPTCSITEPTTTTSVGFPDMHIVMNVYGSTGPSCSANALPWVSTLPVSGTTAPDSFSNVAVVFNSTGLNSGTYTGNLCLNTSDAAKPKMLVPVTLTVNALPALLTISKVGSGSVAQNPLPPYVVGQVVTLTATPDPGWTFAGWSGDLSGMTNPITITLTGDKVVTATFSLSCVPVAGVDFNYTPSTLKVGQPATFNGTVSAGTGVITYTWNFGDGSAVVSGYAQVTHAFPLTVTTRSYTVTLTAANTCSAPVPVAKLLTVQPHAVLLPLVLK